MNSEETLKKYGTKAKEYIGDKEKTEGLLNKVTKMLSKEGLSSIVTEIKDLISYVSDVTKGRYKDYNGWALSTAIGAIIYVVSPIDVIPDFLAGLGFIDDVAIVGYAMKKLHDELQKYHQWKWKEE
ncbi:MAG: DUF1232 domain-containing protein [Bacteroidaceae bacterium]|nr:DUF1232 domain-containing protein [Bacteroidaceae bacterium]